MSENTAACSPLRDENVVNAALMAFAKAGDTKEARLLFPWINDPVLGLRATSATSLMLHRSPDDAPAVLRAFLQWRASERRAQASASDEAVTDMERFRGPLKLTDRENAEVQKSIVCELKRQKGNPNKDMAGLAAKWLKVLPHELGSDTGGAQPARRLTAATLRRFLLAGKSGRTPLQCDRRDPRTACRADQIFGPARTSCTASPPRYRELS